MKINIKNIIFVIGILALSNSCDNFLDVHPKGEVLGKDLLTDQKGFENALYGVYASLRTDELYGHNLSYYNLDIMAQYYSCFGNTFVTEIQQFNYKHSEIEESFYDIWSKMYTNISNVNNVLDNLEHESPNSLGYYNIYKGEALGLRAFMHFDLLRIFSTQITLDEEAAGIPYRTHFSLDATEILKAKEVYKHIISDLQTAEKLLADETLYETSATANTNFLKDQQIHFNQQAVQATLARAYLTQGNLDSALYYARQVIDKQKQTLDEKTEIDNDVAGVLSRKETIFGLYSKNFYNNVVAELYRNESYRSLDLRYDIREIYQKKRVGNDYRWDSWFYTLSQNLRLSKFLDKYVLNNAEYNRPNWQIRGINLIRLPEMYYIAAECLLKQNKYPEALSFFNDMLRSRGLTPLDERYPEETLTLERITEERYKEFIGEGQTFFNMKRLNLDIENTEGLIVPASNSVYVISIPEQEYDYRK